MPTEQVIGAVLTATASATSALFIFTKRAISAYIRQRDEVIKRVGVLEDDLGQAVARANTAEVKASALDGEVARLNSKVDQSDKTIGELLLSLNERDRKLASQSELLKKLQANYEKLQVQVDSLTQEKEQLALEKQKAERRAETAERERDLAQAELRGVVKAHDAMFKALSAPPPLEGKDIPPPPEAQEVAQDSAGADEAIPGGGKK